MSTKETFNASRVLQQDATILDNTVENLILDSIRDFCNLDAKYIYYLQKNEDEVQLSIKSLIWLHRLIFKQTPGQKLMGITYSKHGLLRFVLHYILEVLLPYIKNYFSKNIQYQYEVISSCFELVYQCVFLYFGKYRTVSESLLKIHATSDNIALTNFGNDIEMQKELLFHLFKDLTLVIVPIIQGIKSIKWKKLLQKNGLKQFTNNEVIENESQPFISIKCASCKMPAILPVRNKLNVPNACYHIYCYYCYDSGITCSICDLELPKNGASFVY